MLRKSESYHCIKKTLLLLSLVVLPSILLAVPNNLDLTEQEKTWIKKNPVVIVGGEMDWAPFDYVDDGRYQGLTNDYLNLISKKTGLKFKVSIGLSWNQLVDDFKNQKLDLLPAIYYTKEHIEYGSYTDPYYRVRNYIFTKKDSDIKHFEDFNNKTLAIPKGYSIIKEIEEKHPQIKILETRSILDSISAVLNDEADGMLEIQATMSYLLEKNTVRGIKIIAQDEFKPHPVHMLVQKDNEHLVSIINKSIQSIDPKLRNAISKKWIKFYSEKIIDMQTLIFISLAFLSTLLFLFFYQYSLKKLNTQLRIQKYELEHLVSIDPMTTLYNRRFFSTISKHTVELSIRDKTDLSIFMLDIDRFKSINDGYGHKVGDLVIIKLASILKELTRKSDIVCRFGGEEFLVLLPKTNVDGAIIIAEKIRKKVEDLVMDISNNNIPSEAKLVKFTVSIGVAKINNKQNTDIEDSINRADQALYEAKKNGRNRLVVAN